MPANVMGQIMSFADTLDEAWRALSEIAADLEAAPPYFTNF